MRNQYTNSLHKILVAGAAALLLFSGCIESADPKGPVAGEDSIQMEESPPTANGGATDAGVSEEMETANEQGEDTDTEPEAPVNDPMEEPPAEPTEEPSPVPLSVEEICDRMAAEIVHCLEPTCPSVTQVPTLVQAGLSGGCLKSAERDDAPPPEFVDQLDEQGCAHPVVRAVVQELTDPEGRGGQPGRLHGLCTEGLRVPLDTCEDACTTLRECTPEDDEEGRPLRDADTCMYLCAVSDDAFAPPAWTCIGEVDACHEIGTCFPQP